MEQIGPFTISTATDAGLIGLEYDAGNGRVLAAVLSPDEAEKLIPLLGHIREHLVRHESARIDLRAAFADLIGRDPFDGQL